MKQPSPHTPLLKEIYTLKRHRRGLTNSWLIQFSQLLINSKLFLVAPFAFSIFFFIRLLIKRIFSILLYHICLLLIIFVLVVGGPGVFSDASKRLEQFILLEKNHQLEEAKNNPQNYDSMFQIDLKQFKDSAEFIAYVNSCESSAITGLIVALGLIFVLPADIFTMCVLLLYNRLKKLRRR